MPSVASTAYRDARVKLQTCSLQAPIHNSCKPPIVCELHRNFVILIGYTNRTEGHPTLGKDYGIGIAKPRKRNTLETRMLTAPECLIEIRSKKRQAKKTCLGTCSVVLSQGQRRGQEKELVFENTGSLFAERQDRRLTTIRRQGYADTALGID